MTAWKLVDNYSDHWADLLYAKVECRLLSNGGEHPWHTLLNHSPVRKKVKHSTKSRAANNNSLDSDWSALASSGWSVFDDLGIRLANQLSLSRNLFCSFERVKICSSLLKTDERQVCLPSKVRYDQSQREEMRHSQIRNLRKWNARTGMETSLFI